MPGRLQETVRAASALRQTSLVAGQLLTKAALSDAATTFDGREAIALLRHLTEAVSLAAVRAADTVSALAHNDTASAGILLEQAAAHLAGTPSAVQLVSSALLRHEGYFHAHDRAARENLGTGQGAVKISEAQRKALASLARGDGVLHEASSGLREVVAPLAAYVSVRASTIDALASRDLLTLTPLPTQPDHFGLRVTSDGVRSLLAAAPRPPRSPSLTAPLAAPAPKAAPLVGPRR